MKGRILFATLALVAAVPVGARAQGCDVTNERQANTYGQGTPNQATYLGGNVRVVCRGDNREFRADSMIFLSNGAQRLLIGHAYASDPEKTLTANTINFFGAQQHMVANDDVVLVDKVNGAVINGQAMDYYPAKNGQLSHGTIYGTRPNGARPHAVLKRKPATTPPGAGPTAGAAPASAAAPATPNPGDTASTLVDGDRFEIQGQKTFHAFGNVVLTRLDMKGTAPEAVYDPDADHLRLIGGAKVTGQDFSLTGGTIDGTLAGNLFKDVTATYKAEMLSKDLRVTAPSLTVGFANGQVQNMVALSAARSKRTATDGDALAEAFAQNAGFHIKADSIIAIAPAQKLERVIAVGNAYGERQNDSIDVKNLPPIAATDWLRGDTITGFFVAAKPAPARPANGRSGRGQRPAQRTAAATDTTQRVLDRIVASSANPNNASSVYRIVDEKKPKATPSIAYLVAKTITVAFRDNQVSLVTADGQIRGVHLQPEEKKPVKAKETTARKVAASAAAAGSAQK